jgi:hypothetical protein
MRGAQVLRDTIRVTLIPPGFYLAAPVSLSVCLSGQPVVHQCVNQIWRERKTKNKRKGKAKALPLILAVTDESEVARSEKL